MTDILELFSGVGVVIDEQIVENNESPNGIQKIVKSLKDKHIPIVEYSELPDGEISQFHSVSFVILDWNLSGVSPIPKPTIDDNVVFLKKLKDICFVPVFIFSDEDTHAIQVTLEEKKLYSQHCPIFIKKKDEIDTSEKLFAELEKWIKDTPSIYVLKEWNLVTRKAQNEMLWALSSAHPAWPSVLKKTMKKDGEDPNTELLSLLQNNLSSRIEPPQLDGNILSKITDDSITKEELRAILESERFVTAGLPNHPYAGDLYRDGEKYLINIRPDCDIIRDKKDLYLLEGTVVDESRINSEEANAITFDSGNFLEKINHCYFAFAEGKILEFQFKQFSIDTWENIKNKRVGRILPPYITRIQQKFSYYLQRQGLPAIPQKAIK